MKIIICRGGQQPEVREVGDDFSLEAMQRIVQGNIELIRLSYDEGSEASVDMYLNEEGRLNGLQLNRYVEDAWGRVWDILGNFFIIGGDDSTGESISLTDAQIEEWAERLKLPEVRISSPPEGCILVCHARHPTFMSGDRLDIGLPCWPHDYTPVATVHSDSLDAAFQLTNHIDGPWQDNEGVSAFTSHARSTSVSDVLLLPDGTPMRVASIGFDKVEA
jgi:hypothetical protein